MIATLHITRDRPVSIFMVLVTFNTLIIAIIVLLNPTDLLLLPDPGRDILRFKVRDHLLLHFVSNARVAQLLRRSQCGQVSIHP